MDTNQKRQRERKLQDKRREKDQRRRERAEQKQGEPERVQARPTPADSEPKAPVAPIPPPPHIAAQRGQYSGRVAPSRAPKPGTVNPSSGSRGSERQP